MKQYFFFLMLLVLATNSFGQISKEIVFDTTLNPQMLNNEKHYSKTNFSLVDTLSLWNYQLVTTFKENKNDSIKPIGTLIFWRTKSIDDSMSKHIYNRLWTPYIRFDIFNLSDSVYCFTKATKTRIFSSCLPPEVGGDLIRVDNFLFLNQDVCLNCRRYNNGVDYCRPVINYVFSNIDRSKISTIKSIVSQFIISSGQLPNQEKQNKLSD